MFNKKQVLTSVGIFLAVYLVLLLPIFGGSTTYADFYRKQANYFFHTFGDHGFIVFEGHDDNGSDDTRIYQANKDLADAKGNVTSVPYNISTHILGYLPSILLIALFAATPIKLWKRALLLLAGFLTLHLFLMFFLYILILAKYLNTPWLHLYQDLGTTTKNIVQYLNASVNHGMGLNNFLVVIIWLTYVFYFERNILSGFLQIPETKK